MIKVENYFEFLANDSDELMLLCESSTETPHKPIMIFDGGKTALLQRSQGETKKLTNIDNDVANIIKNSKSLLVIEINKTTESITYTYPTPIKILKRLPK